MWAEICRRKDEPPGMIRRGDPLESLDWKERKKRRELELEMNGHRCR